MDWGLKPQEAGSPRSRHWQGSPLGVQTASFSPWTENTLFMSLLLRTLILWDWGPTLRWPHLLFFFFFKFIYLFFSCVGSSFLCKGPPQLQQAGATPHRGARAPHHRGLSCCGAQAPDAQAQQSWLTGPVAPRHVGSSQTRARTRVPCIGRRTLNHCATREAPHLLLITS